MHKTAKTYIHPAQQARAMRDKAMSVAMKRKEEYLGARVPKALKEKVISRADELGIPVSLLLRKVLEEVFSEEQTLLKLDLIKHGAEKKEYGDATKRFVEVIAWKDIQLNQVRDCEVCGEPMPAGSHVMMGIVAGNSDVPILCTSCQQGVVKQTHA